MVIETPALDWSAFLASYVRRNAGRRTRLAMDDPVLGAQWNEIDFPLRSISFDSRDNRIEIRLGEERGLESQLTHSIAEPCALEVRRGPAPGAEELCIRHANGCTLLQFV
jgi:hypothetical protein